MRPLRKLSFLQSFPGIRTRDVDEMLAYFAPLYSVRQFEQIDHAATELIFNHCQLPLIDLGYSDYSFRLRASLEQNDYFVQGFPVSGSGKAKWNNNFIDISPVAGGIVGGPGSVASLEYSNGFSNLILKIAPNILTKKLSLLIGTPIDRALLLTGHSDPTLSTRQRRLVTFLAQELEHAQEHMADFAIAELEEAIVINFLMAHEHNLSHLISGASPMAAPWQVRRAVDYIEQYWDQSITIEKLTEIAETSARSLFLMFKKTYDVSPMVYVSKVRLRRAHEMLCGSEPGINVTKVGCMCGFSNLGNFAMRYFQAYGEKPSDTLKNKHRRL